MTTANVTLALNELRREYAEVEAERERVQQKLNALETRRYRLGEAIGSLERLDEPWDSPPEAEPTPEPDTTSTLDDAVPDGPLVPPDSPLMPSSTWMVKDVVG